MKEGIYTWGMVIFVFVCCFLAFDYVISADTHWNTWDVAQVKSGASQGEIRESRKKLEAAQIERHVKNMNSIKWPKVTMSYVWNELTRGYRYPETIEEEVRMARRTHG